MDRCPTNLSSKNCQTTQPYPQIVLLSDFVALQGEDMRDLDDAENDQSLRKELAPLLEPLEMKDVCYSKMFFSSSKSLIFVCSRFLDMKLHT